MLKELFPSSLGALIEDRFNFRDIYEIRIRSNKPIIINYLNRFVQIKNEKGVSICADKKLIEYILSRATDLSLYKYNNQIKNGFLSVAGGIRIGIAGEIVIGETGEIKTIKNFSSLTIRIPHEIRGCSDEIINLIIDEKTGIKNTLIISPPGCGKTTFLRDIARNLSSCFEEPKNILIIDERYEIASCDNGVNSLNVGVFTDVLSGSTKEYGFYAGIRSMRPDVIITDEISSKSDIAGLKYASSCGVKIIASTHGYGHLDLKRKGSFNSLLEDKVFDRYIILSDRNGAGTIELVLNSAFEPLMVLWYLFIVQ